MTRKKVTLFLALPFSIIYIFFMIRQATNMTKAQDTLAQPAGFGGGEFVLSEHVPHLSLVEREEIELTLQENMAQLQTNGLYTPLETTNAISLTWPLTLASGLRDWGYHGISNFVDQNPDFPNFLLDYACGDRTYDLSTGYNHQGVDFFTWPFGWRKMDNDEVAIIAAADGVIIYKQDGNFDRSCSFGGTWNAVYVAHADGSIAWYGHMKEGSLTSKNVGESVAAGEYLGIVGSSGSSTGPHLHLELYNSAGDLQDPYAGTCNSLNSFSWWEAQRPYYDSAVNKITISPAAVIFPACPNPAIIDEQYYYQPGDTIYFTTYYRDQLDFQISTYILYQPDNNVYAIWTHNSPVPHYAASYWYWWFDFPPNAQTGLWTFEVVFGGETYEQTFWVGVDTPTPTSTPVVTSTPTLTPTPTSTLVPTSTLSPTATILPIATHTPTPTVVPTITPIAVEIYLPVLIKQ